MEVPRGSLDGILFRMLGLVCALYPIFIFRSTAAQTAQLSVDASPQNTQMIPENMFGIFFEEINHAGAGGLWAELVNNRGFEAGGLNTPSNIDPWLIIGDESNIIVATDRSSCFPTNPIALQMEVLCQSSGNNVCPPGGVGIYNPGFWGMNIEETKVYKFSMYIRSSDPVDLTVSLTSSDGLQNLAAHTIIADSEDFQEWTKVEFDLQSSESNSNSRLQLTTSKSGIIWFDQVSLMPSDTYMGHGYRKDLASMLANLKPKFLKFPGGNYVMGNYLLNAFRWSETVGPWEERPGHFNDVWGYWTDDGLGLFEFLQLAEDIGASPVWVVNDGASRNEQIPSATIAAFVKDVVDGIEFARGDPGTSWGSVRAAMGHPEPFQLNYISMGNQECSMHYYKENYRKFYSAIKASYPDIKIISSCDRSTISPIDPADLYDVHVYTSSGDMFSKSRMFDSTPRGGPKAIVSEYAVIGNDAGRGTLVAALAEAAFLIGLERNSDVVEMASCAPLFVNDNDRRWGSIGDRVTFGAVVLGDRGANDEEDVVTSDTSRSPRHGGRGSSSGGGLVQVLVKHGVDSRGPAASAERPGAVASAERRGVAPELLEVWDDRRGSSRLLEALPPLLLEATPPLLIERKRSAGGGAGGWPTSTNSSPAPAGQSSSVRGRVI